MKTLSEARTEIKARGFNRFSDSRLTSFLSDASQEINNYEAWPWLTKTATGTAPLTISDLRNVLYVTDTTQKSELRGLDVRHLIDINTDLTTTGTPWAYYLDGLDTLKVYPANTSNSLSVHYIKEAPALSADEDTPIFPDAFEGVWLDLAQVRCYIESTDQPERAAALRAEIDRRLVTLSASYLARVYSNPGYILVTGNDGSFE